MQVPTKSLIAILIAFVSLYIFGYFFPDYWWSVHFIRFTSPIIQVIILVLLLVLGYKLYKTSINESIEFTRFKLTIRSVIIFSISLLLLTIVFPMVQDFYGDAYKFNKFLPKTPTLIPTETHDKFFTFSLSPWAGEGTVLSLITYIAYFLQVTYKTAFILFDAIFGGLFVFFWLQVIRILIKNDTWKVILTLTGITAPFMLVFFGHIEIYAPVFFINILWIYITLLFIKTEKAKYLWLVLLILLIGLKLHSTSVLCIPALFLLFWKNYQGTYPNWKQVSYFVLTPIFIIGLFLYFFYFEDHIDNRSLQSTAMAFEHLFLPLFSPEPPLDQYNLLSFNHFFDFFSVILLWSPIALFLLILLLILKRKEVNWNAPEVLILGVCFILFTTFFFVVNPLLGMPIDWDLFSLPAPYLLAFTAVVVSQVEKYISPSKILYASGIIAALNLPVFVVHQSERALSERLESVAARMYTTYYEWTAKTIEHAYSLNDPFNINRLERGEDFRKKIGSKAQKGIDYEYATLVVDQGRYFLRIQNDPVKALGLFTLAQEYAPAHNAKLLSLEAYFALQQYENAFMVAEELVLLRFPSVEKALKIKLHCALEAQLYQEAFETCTVILKNWPDNKIVEEVYQRLHKNDRIKELKFLFANKFRK
ncbi:hypothetical protein ACWGOQ_0013810 [Aquimarina sp. M1]